MSDFDRRERKRGGLEWLIPRTEEELARVRARSIAHAKEHDYSYNFTCDDCGARFSCTLAYDLYNTNGDCLAEK